MIRLFTLFLSRIKPQQLQGCCAVIGLDVSCSFLEVSRNLGMMLGRGRGVSLSCQPQRPTLTLDNINKPKGFIIHCGLVYCHYSAILSHHYCFHYFVS